MTTTNTGPAPRRYPTAGEIRQQAREFRAQIREAARTMGGGKVPRAIWCPGPRQWLSAGQYAKALQVIAGADPAQEFKQSFGAWYPKTAAEIRRGEVIPALHERINARGLMQSREGSTAPTARQYARVQRMKRGEPFGLHR